MKKETEEVLDAPYTLQEHSYGVYNKDGDEIAWASEEWDRNRILRIPELYENLWCATKAYCIKASFDCHSEEDCSYIKIKTGFRKDCLALPWIELLRKIKDGK